MMHKRFKDETKLIKKKKKDTGKDFTFYNPITNRDEKYTKKEYKRETLED